MRPELEDVRISSRPLKTLISRVTSGIKLDRVPGTYAQNTDSRGRIVTAIKKVQNSVTPQMTTEMVALYRSGATAREVAREFGVHRQTVARHLQSAGVMRKPGLSDDQAEQAEALYLSGLTLSEVADRFGVSQGTVGRYLRNRGVELRPPLVRACAVSPRSLR